MTKKSSGSPHHVAQGLNTVAFARRGIGGWVLNVNAKTGYSAGIFGDGVGYGAIYEASRVINQFRTELKSEKYLAFNPGLISGGSEIKTDRKNARVEAIGKTNIISFDIAKYIDCLDGLGASGSGLHKPGEVINLKEFPILIQRVALMIYRLSRNNLSLK